MYRGTLKGGDWLVCIVDTWGNTRIGAYVRVEETWPPGVPAYRGAVSATWIISEDDIKRSIVTVGDRVSYRRATVKETREATATLMLAKLKGLVW